MSLKLLLWQALFILTLLTSLSLRYHPCLVNLREQVHTLVESAAKSTRYHKVMLQKLLIFLLLGASSCSTMTQSLVEELPISVGNPILKTATSIKAATATLAEQSPKKVARPVAMQNEYELSSNVKKSLDAYKWNNRLLLVFAPNEDSPTYQQQMQRFQGKQADLSERDLLVFELLAQGTSRVNGQSITPEEAAQVRQRFNVGSQDFRVILVGKDGTAKRRDRTPVSPEVIFKEIDAMPMRQQEMNSRRG